MGATKPDFGPKSETGQAGLVLPAGIEAGLLGGLAVVAVFLVRDVLAGEPLWTPSILGTLLLEGSDAVRMAEPSRGAAAFYNAIHFVLWMLGGFAATRALRRVEIEPSRWVVPPLLAGAMLLILLGLDAWIAGSGVGRLHLWVGGLAGIAAVAAFASWRYPLGARRVLRRGRD